MAVKAKWYRRFYDWLVRKWFITSVFFSLSSLWFLLLQLWGKQWQLMDDKGVLIPKASVLSFVFAISNVIFSLIKTYSDRRNEDGKHQGQEILDKVLDELGAAKKVKLGRYINGIISYGTGTDKIKLIEPSTQIGEILKTIQSAICRITGLDKSKVGVGVIIKKDINSGAPHEGWDSLPSLNIDGDLSMQEILSDKHSTVRQIIDKNVTCKFWPDKHDGYIKSEYVANRNESNNENIPWGSIYCKDISIKTENDQKVILKAIITVTTYENYICGPNDDSEIARFCTKIMPAFELRLKIELCLLYIERFL
ncbi:MAG: hypothetical protein MdMp014T_2314 [Treponematales bacterium]